MNKLDNEALTSSSKKEHINYKEYNLVKDNNEYLCIIKRVGNKIIISIDNYEIELKLNEIKSLIFNDNQNNANEDIFSYLLNFFEKNKVYIKEININKNISLIFKLNFGNKEEKEIILVNKNENKDYIINSLNQHNANLIKELSFLYEQNELIKREIKNLKSFENTKALIINRSFSFSLSDKKSIYYSPIYIQFEKSITNDSYAHFGLDNTFIIYSPKINFIHFIYNLLEQIKFDNHSKYNEFPKNFRN